MASSFTHNGFGSSNLLRMLHILSFIFLPLKYFKQSFLHLKFYSLSLSQETRISFIYFSFLMPVLIFILLFYDTQKYLHVFISSNKKCFQFKFPICILLFTVFYNSLSFAICSLFLF